MKPTIASKADAAVLAEGQTGHGEGGRVAPRRGGSRGVPKWDPADEASGTDTRRAWSLKVAAEDYIWLYDYRHGTSIEAIAAREGVSVRRVREALERARELDRKASREAATENLRSGRTDDHGFRLMPLFPIGAFTPQSACPHHAPIEEGSRLCCMVCHASGMDDHPGLRHDPETDPSPEPTPTPTPTADAEAPSQRADSKETRKQKRRRQFARATMA